MKKLACSYFLILGGIYIVNSLKVGLLDQRVNANVVLLNIAKMAFRGVLLLSIPISNAWNCLSYNSPSPTAIERMLSTSEFLPTWQYLSVVLICIFITMKGHLNFWPVQLRAWRFPLTILWSTFVLFLKQVL